MKNIGPDFEFWEKYISELPPVYKNITYHTIFDVKMGKNYRRKARFVADGHKTKTPAEITYLSVVSRDLVWIALTIAELNNLDVLACDKQNAYHTADCRELVWVVARPESGSEVGKNMLEYFKLKYNKIEPPDVYIGSKLAKMKLHTSKVTYINQLG